MKSRFRIGIIVAALLVAVSATAAVDSAAEFLARVQQMVDRGEVTADEALLLKFQYCFDREKLPTELQPTWLAPMKCATPLIQEFEAVRGGMAPEMAAMIEGYLAEPQDGSRVIYDSPSGRFHITYQVAGGDAVPLADGNSNGVPDYVENIGAYLDYCLDYECTTLGFQSPPFQISYPYMNINILALSGVYGFTSIVTNPPGMTRITLDNDYAGFPPNDDPDGDALGAAKVTCAHEFKHSSQYAGSRWTEGAWGEVDATWMEDIAYPLTNDYVNYIQIGSPITAPTTSLDLLSGGGYESAVWEHYQSQTHGIQFVVDLWTWRKTHTGQAMLDSYEQIFTDYGSSIRTAWNEFSMWNFATGARTVLDSGYEDALEYPAGSAQRTPNTYPHTYSASVAHLAANFIRCLNVSAVNKRMQVTFNGADAAQLTLAAVVNYSYVTHVGEFYTIPLNATNDVVYTIPYDLNGVYSIGLIVGNGAKSGAVQSFNVTIELVDFDPSAVGDAVPAFAIAGNHPNPFNPTTSIEFALTSTGRTTLDVFDLAGRQVRTLVDATMVAGRHTVMWDGQDEAGRSLPSGTYIARLASGDHVASHKLVLAK
ncbi:MAG TPA: FlgD immunoglobulin-like domain containing protein [Candidatus Krumholzibacteria bacterium]|nr:FlgD immunoglobulin-like domain containing protein [Candidatus Krumholzibacteria bacterium]HPD70850.1 FlgD immunoglobulin-like domain containing protein [Candidatus Krumholzibacteria bacterium]HRY39450.1 FlgD immunoglobulin-like domain containing protein [Candidatus Krumholzibacteria bacterium]